MERYDVLIVGGGPTGLACGIEAQKAGLRYIIIEKGGIVDTIRRFPTLMTFFSTPELLELDDIPFITGSVRPTRAEALHYYRRVAQYRELNMRLHTQVAAIRKRNDIFNIETHTSETLIADNVIIATGYFDNANRLEAEGATLPHVKYYYDEPYLYAGSDVVVIGGRNSAVQTALELYRHGARVTLVHRGDALGDSVKYWIRQDIENRIASGEIAAYFNFEARTIHCDRIEIRHNVNGESISLPAQFVFALIGYRPDETLLRNAGIQLTEDTLIPSFDPATFETNVKRLYVAGSVSGGCETWKIFIENGRMHAKPIITDIMQRRRK